MIWNSGQALGWGRLGARGLAGMQDLQVSCCPRLRQPRLGGEQPPAAESLPAGEEEEVRMGGGQDNRTGHIRLEATPSVTTHMTAD